MTAPHSLKQIPKHHLGLQDPPLLSHQGWLVVQDFMHINSRKPLAEKNMPNIRPMKVTKKSPAVFSQKDKDDERKLEDAISRAFIGIII